jgi:hypothetical protein
VTEVDRNFEKIELVEKGFGDFPEFFEIPSPTEFLIPLGGEFDQIFPGNSLKFL